MAPNNLEFDFKQISLNPFESPPDGKIFQNGRNPDLNYCDEINIPSKETTHINETDRKNFLYEQRFLRTFLSFMLTSEDWKSILKTFAIF